MYQMITRLFITAYLINVNQNQYNANSLIDVYRVCGDKENFPKHSTVLKKYCSKTKVIYFERNGNINGIMKIIFLFCL